MFLALLLMFMGCATNAQSARESNDAARISQTKAAAATPPLVLAPTSTPLNASIEAVDIQKGDCVNSRLPEGIDIESVEIVECSGSWQYRALSSFRVKASGPYPGADYFLRQATRDCDRRYSNILAPNTETWLLGGRTVICIQASYGLASSQLEKLDRLVGGGTLHVGECMNKAPETSFLLVELVSCEADWELRVIGSFDIQGTDTYPGKDYIGRRAEIECGRRFVNTFIPTPETWSIGDRTVACLQNSYGLADKDPKKIDRLVSINSLRDRECYNDAPETGFVMIELVNCSGDWEFQALNSFEVSLGGSFPGKAYFDAQAGQNCDPHYNVALQPTADSWAQGDRLVVCLTVS